MRDARVLRTGAQAEERVHEHAFLSRSVKKRAATEGAHVSGEETRVCMRGKEQQAEMSYRASERRRRTDRRRTRLRTRGAREMHTVVRRVARDGEDVQRSRRQCKSSRRMMSVEGETCSGEETGVPHEREVRKHGTTSRCRCARRASAVHRRSWEWASVNPSRSADVPRHSGGWHFRMTAHSIPYE